MQQSRALCVWVSVSVLVCVVLWGDGGSVHADDSTPYLRYWHNWASEDGVSHFTECNMTIGWEAKQFNPGDPPLFSHLTSTNATLKWFYIPPRWNPGPELHPNPAVQWGVWFSGQTLFTAGDGSQVYLGPGDVYLGDDVGSDGHHSMNSGYGPAVSAMIAYNGETGYGPCWPSKIAATPF
eukprot:TRINITY_DN18759_c0_g1_i1.p1 TRINITY_DN18759_c0_g1~~TRINITY_DN18759_c0_g1_i1.p1  ORF type:complete len:180 (-),score=27.62 TRINITY_DN18759_c0_g1_i1:43-582(-)